MRSGVPRQGVCAPAASSFVTRKITASVAAMAHGRAQPASRWATSTPAATGAGPRTTWTRSSAPPVPTNGHNYVVATGVAHSVRDFVAAAFARAGTRRLGSAWWTLDADLVAPADSPTQLVGF